MQISQLSVVTDVPVPTLKYYLREGLLMPGTALSATRADYDDSHVERVRLLRALIDVGRLSLADAGRVIATLDAGPGTDLAEVLGTAHAALPAPGADEEVSDAVRALMAELGWCVDPATPALHSLSKALRAATDAGMPLSAQDLHRYAAASLDIAAVDLDVTLAQPTLADMLRIVIVGTVLVDEVLSALRRLAEGHVAQARLSPPSDERGQPAPLPR